MSCDRVLLAAPRSFCAGVEMAIKALAWMVRAYGPPVYCYHEIVHNEAVVDRFRRAGVRFVDAVDDVPPGAPLMLSAHGSAPEVVAAARARTDVVVDAVCPLVRKVHHELRHRAGRGHTVVYAGHAGHDEAVGTLAVAPAVTHLVEGPDDVAALPLGGPDGAGGAGDGAAPVAFLAQTTLAVGDWEDTLAAARARFGEVWVPGRRDLCFATTNRQAAVRAMAPRCDAVVVIGSASSSNTLALARVAEAAAGAGRPLDVLRVDGPDELPDGLAGTVGVTAGASAPEDLVTSVLERLAPRDGVEVVDVTTEHEYFPPPRELRDLARSAGVAAPPDDRSVAASDALRALGDGPPPARRGMVAPVGAPVEAQAPGPADVPALLGAHSARVEREMADLVDAEVDDGWLRGAIGYHLGWRDEAFAPLPAGARPPAGKKLRAALAVLAHRATAERPDDIDRVAPLAAALELTHNWSLVHDDIEDGDRTRRGRPALWTLCGEAQAINVGDCLHALAARSLVRLRGRGVPDPVVADLLAGLARAVVELTVGQMRDLAFESTTTVDDDDYVCMIDGKTAALMACATHSGALLGSGDPAVAGALGRFGRRLGLAFQCRDDVLGIWGADAETGKPTGADIRRRKKSLPIVLALDRATGADRGRLHALYRREQPPGPDDEAFVRAALDACDAHALAQRAARRHRDEALAALAEADAAAGAAGRPLALADVLALRALADFVTDRTH